MAARVIDRPSQPHDPWRIDDGVAFEVLAEGALLRAPRLHIERWVFELPIRV
jgi:hypothetical protein